LLALGIGSLQTVLERGQTEDWFATGYITFLTVTSILAIAGFVLWELHVEHPVVNLRIFKTKTLTIAAILTFITGIGMFTSIFLTPVIAQRLLGFTPTQTGLLLLPGAIIAILGLIVSGKLMQFGVSPLIIITAGFLCFIYFNWSMFGLSPDTSAGTITTRLVFRALGMAFLTVPLTVLAVSSLQPKDIPQGAALNNMMRQLGGSFGISIINTYTARRIASHRTDLISHITNSNPLAIDRINSVTAYFQHKGASLIDARQKAMGIIDLSVVKQSALLSYTDAYFLIGLLFAVTLPLLLFVAGGPKKNIPKVAISDH
jgi:DHA2 family multidrug resistance protein